SVSPPPSPRSAVLPSSTLFRTHPDGSEIRHKRGCVERTRVHYAERQGEVFVQKLEEAHGYAQEPRRSYELCRQFVHGCFFRGAEIGRAHVCTPVTFRARLQSEA